jgi:redox-sensitive bicupin YhaK (pirin superfamily)
LAGPSPIGGRKCTGAIIMHVQSIPLEIPMLSILAAARRGHTDAGWLDSHHSFSFGEFYDPKQMGFRTLRVINEDRVQPGQGFGTHGHRDMEIITYVLEGALEHKDSLGTGSVIRPGDVQRMSAGTGVRHSEFNASRVEPVHFLQIWILPEKQGIAPGYEQKTFAPGEVSEKLRLVASHDGRDSSLTIHQDAEIYAGKLRAGTSLSQSIAPGRYGWLQVARGQLKVAGSPVGAGDGVAIAQETSVLMEAVSDAEVLFFDLA